MRNEPLESEPHRLAESEGAVANVLRRAQHEASGRLDEGAAFARVERVRQRRSLVAWNLAGASLAAAAAAVVFGSRMLQPTSDIRAEAIPGPRSAAPIVRGPAPAPAPPAVEKGVAVASAIEPPVSNSSSARLMPPSPRPRTRSSVRREAPALSQNVAPEPAGGVAPPTEALCRSLLGEPQGDRAIHCFRELSKADDLAADVALYEAARLSVARGHDPTGALALLEEHQRRFPNSALRVEVEWSRAQALRAAGRSGEALAASERLLERQRDGALATELHWFRARIFKDERRDCASALSELVALIGLRGGRGDQAEWERAQCLETLGRVRDAESAYRHYLNRAHARHAQAARQRLSELATMGGK